MQLQHVCDFEIRFTRYAFAHATAEDINWNCYAEGNGSVSGASLRGVVRWSNRARWRDDNVWLPRLDGVVDTDDGAQILFVFRGYNRSIRLDGNWRWRQIDGGITFLSGDQRYSWMNDVSGVVEGLGAWPEDEDPDEEERWRLRVFAARNELTAEAGGTSPWARSP
jgi:hypothetical protein